MTSEDNLVPLLRAIYKEPENLTIRGVLGDYLEEEGDPRADLVRLSVRLLSVPVPKRYYSGEYFQVEVPEPPEHLRNRQNSRSAGFHNLGRLLSTCFLHSYCKLARFSGATKDLTVIWARNCLLTTGSLIEYPGLDTLPWRFRHYENVRGQIIGFLTSGALGSFVSFVNKFPHATNPDYRDKDTFRIICKTIYDKFIKDIPWEANKACQDILREQKKARHEKRMARVTLPMAEVSSMIS